VTRRLPASLRMIARNLARKPLKAVLSVLGIAFAVGLMVVGRFGLDGASYMMAVQFDQVQRDDVTVLYSEPRPARATLEIARLAGVAQAESFRVIPAWLRHENHAKRMNCADCSTRN
jgi:putative ABC transport system permease protein